MRFHPLDDFAGRYRLGLPASGAYRNARRGQKQKRPGWKISAAHE
jgi:hypothetical protein